jgi:hypothetical protein
MNEGQEKENLRQVCESALSQGAFISERIKLKAVKCSCNTYPISREIKVLDTNL